MDRKTNLIPALLLSALSLYAMEDVKVTQFQHAGPFTVNKPILADSLNVNGKPFEAKNLLKATLPFEQTLANATVLDADTAGAITFAAPRKGYALHLFSFFLNSDRYVKGTLDISGPGAFEVFVNDKPVGASSELVMEPRRYQVVVKYLTAETDTCPPSLKATFKSFLEPGETLHPSEYHRRKGFPRRKSLPERQVCLGKIRQPVPGRQERIVRAIDGCRYGTGLIARRRFLDNRQMDA